MFSGSGFFLGLSGGPGRLSLPVHFMKAPVFTETGDHAKEKLPRAYKKIVDPLFGAMAREPAYQKNRFFIFFYDILDEFVRRRE